MPSEHHNIDLGNFPRATAPVHVLIDRINYHRQPGKLLHGLYFEQLIQNQAIAVTKNNTPLLFLRSVSTDNQPAKAGASSRAGGKNTVPLLNQTTIIFELKTDSKQGWVSSIRKEKGHIDWLNAVMDCLEIDPYNTQIDMSLMGTLTEPFIYEIEPPTTEGFVTTQISIVCSQEFLPRGKRSIPFD